VTNRISAFLAILLTAGCLVTARLGGGVSGWEYENQTAPPSRCTKEALAALRPIPTLEYECLEQAEDNLKSVERRSALKDYQRELEIRFADGAWWAAPVDDLNVCSISHEARGLSSEEARDFDAKIDLHGDRSTRLITVVDPCIWYSARTLNAFVLERVDGKVHATQVLDGYFTRVDAAVNLTLGQDQGQRLILVETHTSDGFMPPSLYTTCDAYTIDARSHRAIPKRLFKVSGKLTNRFRYDNYLFDDETLAKQWRAPEMIRDGRLAPRFYVCNLGKGRLLRSTYVWNGKFYTRMR
jgi:hypothetical protein